jgi:hypothetical protein
MNIEKNGIFLTIPLVLQKFSQIFQTMLEWVNENIHKPLWCTKVFIACKFFGINVF